MASLHAAGKRSPDSFIRTTDLDDLMDAQKSRLSHERTEPVMRILRPGTDSQSDWGSGETLR
jgi:hypothetical protein